VEITGAGTTNHVVQGNLIGTDATGIAALGNGGSGVVLSGPFSIANSIGGTADGAGNTIAFNGHDGVLVDSSTRNSIRENSISFSGNLGIELVNNGNDNQAAPMLASATSDGSTITIQGTLTDVANTTFTLEFFANDTPNPSGFGEGQQFLGRGLVTTDAGGTATFTLPFTVAVDFISATATAPNGDTSAFAADVTVSSPPITPGLVIITTSRTPVAVASQAAADPFIGVDHGGPLDAVQARLTRLYAVSGVGGQGSGLVRNSRPVMEPLRPRHSSSIP
jgi:hypothetical protein